MRNFLKKVLTIVAGVGSFFLGLPRISYGNNGLLPSPPEGGRFFYGFDHFISLVNNLIQFVLTHIAIPLTVIIITFAGIWMVIYASNDSEREKAKNMLITAVIGLFLALAGYVIIQTVVGVLTGESGIFWQFLQRRGIFN